MIRYRCWCKAELTPSGVCTMNPNHAPPGTEPEQVCQCGNIMRLGENECDECRFAAMADYNPKERD